MKINENNHEFIYENFVNFDCNKIFYDFNGNNENYGLNQEIITTSKNIIEFYSFIDVKKSVEMKNNKNNNYQIVIYFIQINDSIISWYYNIKFKYFNHIF